MSEKDVWAWVYVWKSGIKESWVLIRDMIMAMECFEGSRLGMDFVNGDRSIKRSLSRVFFVLMVD